MEQRGGRGYPLKSRLEPTTRTNKPVQSFVSFPQSGARCGTVWLCLLILAFPPSGAVWCGSFAYIAVSTANSQASSRNTRVEPTYFSTLLRWVTKPS